MKANIDNQTFACKSLLCHCQQIHAQGLDGYKYSVKSQKVEIKIFLKKDCIQYKYYRECQDCSNAGDLKGIRKPRANLCR